MRKYIPLLICAVATTFAACSSTPKKESATTPVSAATNLSSHIDQAKIERVLHRLRAELAILQGLEEKMYSKSIKGDRLVEKEINRKINL